MPQHTIKSKAEKKRIVLAEPATSKAKKVGFLKVPIHLSNGPQRLPNKESEYIHRSRPVAAPLSKGQVQAIAAYKRGVGLPEIAKSTGLPSQTLIKTLKTEGLSEETHKQELEQLEIWYKNRRNP